MIQTYLMFEGRCEEAIEFYKQALDAEVQMLMRYKDSPEPPPGCDSPQNDEKVMHAEFRVGDTLLMAGFRSFPVERARTGRRARRANE